MSVRIEPTRRYDALIDGDNIELSHAVIVFKNCWTLVIGIRLLVAKLSLNSAFPLLKQRRQFSQVVRHLAMLGCRSGPYELFGNEKGSTSRSQSDKGVGCRTNDLLTCVASSNHDYV